jgi:transcription elongation GreA/GreB family factor
MLTIQTNKLMMVKDDHDLIIDYLKKNKAVLKGADNAFLLSKMEQAELLAEPDFPWEVIRLNSKVIIRDKVARLNYTYTVVMPEHADHRKCKVSLFSPIGSALFGFRRGEDTYWQTANGRRYFTIMAVSQFAHR